MSCLAERQPGEKTEWMNRGELESLGDDDDDRLCKGGHYVSGEPTGDASTPYTLCTMGPGINADSLLDQNNKLTGSDSHTLTRGNRRRIMYREKEAKEHTAVLLDYFA